MKTLQRRNGLPETLALLFGVPPAIAVAMLAAGLGGSGHPSLSAVLALWASYPTLAGYVSGALEGFDFPSMLFLCLGVLEYPLLGFGIGSIVARAKAVGDMRTRVGLLAFVGYVVLQLASHVVLSSQSVNLRLMAHSNPAVAEAAVDRIRRSGDSAAIPALQQKFIEEEQRQGYASQNLIDGLTQLGGAEGWLGMLESGRLGVAGRVADAWRAIVQNVNSMMIPGYFDVRGGLTTDSYREEDIARLFDALALALAEYLRTTPDSETALTLISVLKDRPDLCTKYVAIVPNGLRARPTQATYDLHMSLAAIKRGRRPDGGWWNELPLSREEIMRLRQDQAAVADEWSTWAQSDSAACRVE